MKERMVYKKGGFINFYKFNNETYLFDKKFTIINGENSAGKTTSMVTLMPNLLTLKESDSIGIRNDKSKSFSFYLKNDSTSYLWASIENSEKTQVLIIAYDKSPKDNSISKTGFVIKENKTIEDVRFYDSNNHLYTRSEFRNKNKEIIDLSTSSPTEYKKEVNNRLFGFEDIKYYENYMDLITNLTKATTKNNTRLTIEEIKDSLMNSLIDPRESVDEPLNVFVRGIENEYEAKKELDAIHSNISLIQDIYKNVNDLNIAPYFEISQKSKQIDEICNKYYKSLNNLRSELEITNKDLGDINTLIEDINEKRNKYKTELDLIDVSDYEGLSLRISQIKIDLNELSAHKKELEEKLRKQESDYRSNLENLKRINENKLKTKKIIDGLKLKNPLFKDDLDFNAIKVDISKQERIIKERDRIDEKIKKINILNKNEKQNLEENMVEVDKLELEKDELVENYLSLFNRWSDKYALNLPVVTSIETLVNNNNYEDIQQEMLNNFNKEILQLDNKKHQIENEIELIDQNIQSLKINKKPFTPNEFNNGKELYELVDFKEAIDDDTKLKIEAGLKESKLMYTIFNSNDILHGIAYSPTRKLSDADNSLLKYLKITTEDKNVYREVEAFLSYIYVNPSTKQLYTGSVRYVTQKENKVTYIGEKNRQKERLLQIGLLQNSRLSKQSEIQSINSQIAETTDNRDDFSRSYKNLLTPSMYIKVVNLIENKQDEISKRELTIKKNNEELQENENKSNELYVNLSKDLPTDKDSLYDLERELSDFKEFVVAYKNIEDQLSLLSNTVNAYEENISDIKENVESLITKMKRYDQEKDNIESKLNDTRILDKINRKNVLENKIREADDASKRAYIKKGGIDNVKEDLEKKIKKEEKNYNVYIANKKVKDEILAEYNIRHIERQKNVDKNKCLNVINDRKSLLNNLDDAMYKVNTFYCNSPVVSLNEICGELDYILSQIKNICYLRYINAEHLEESEAIATNNLKDKLVICETLCNKKASEAYIRLFGEELLDPIKKAMIDSENVAKVIEDKLEKQKQDGITSYFLKYKEKDVDYKSKTALNIIKGKIDYTDSRARDFFDSLARKVYDGIEENKDRNEIMEEIYNEINYKNYFSFKIMVLKKDEKERRDLTTKILSGLSSGELYRAFLELAIIQLEAAKYKANKNDTMPLFAQIDEIGNNLDPIQISRIENILAESFTNIIATSPDKYYVGSKHDACYIRLVNLNDDYVVQESKVLDEVVEIQTDFLN